jgi:hypothetical protein
VVGAVAAAAVVVAVAAAETLGTSIEDGTRRALSSRTRSTRDPREQLAHPTHSRVVTRVTNRHIITKGPTIIIKILPYSTTVIRVIPADVTTAIPHTNTCPGRHHLVMMTPLGNPRRRPLRCPLLRVDHGGHRDTSLSSTSTEFCSIALRGHESLWLLLLRWLQGPPDKSPSLWLKPASTLCT